MRLEPGGGGAAAGSAVFQFHKGAIRTLPFRLLICLLLNFNSIKVRLELSVLKSVLP